MADKQDFPRSRPFGVQVFPLGYGAPPDNGNFDFEAFTDSMRKTRRNRPHPVELLVERKPFYETLHTFARAVAIKFDLLSTAEGAEPEGDISIFLVVTDIRVVWHELSEEDWFMDCYQDPEFEVEGWLLDPPGNPQNKVCVILKLMTTGTDELAECRMYLLSPGEERGTEQTSGVL